jgi:hypothetical protein
MRILFLTLVMFLHPVHVSLTGIEYNSENRIYAIFVKVYADDLEADMKLNSGCEKGPFEDENEKYGSYLCDRIMIIENGEKLGFKMLGAETDGLEKRFTLEARGGKSVRNVTLVNRIMTRLHSDQANMVLFSFDDIQEGLKLTATDTLRNYKMK